MNVVSLFDGMSCGQIALTSMDAKIDNYFASEIDKFAIQTTMHNFPHTIQLGSVTELGISNFKGQKIDLFIGGSPCQSFSFAGKRKGMSTTDKIEIHTLEHYLKLKGEGYEFEGQSYLFWEYVRLLRLLKPTYFLLENVRMEKKWEVIISKALGVNPILINSSLVSAQNRNRLYWTNIGMEPQGLFGDMQSIIQQPTNKGILLKDILEEDVADKYYLSDKMLKWLKNRAIHKPTFGKAFKIDREKATPLRVAPGKCSSSDNYVSDQNGKAKCFTAGGNSGGLHSQMDLIEHPKTKDQIPTTIYQRGRGFNKGFDKELDKMPPLTSHVFEQNNFIKQQRIRRLTPTECKRLQTVPDWYDMSIVSDTQQYKMLGNGWTIEVIKHIMSYLPHEMLNNNGNIEKTNKAMRER